MNDNTVNNTDIAGNILKDDDSSQLLSLTIIDRAQLRFEDLDSKDARSWADAVTTRIRTNLVDVAEAALSFEKKKTILIEAIQEAYDGKAWKVKKYDSWNAYWQDQFGEAKLFADVKERNEAIKFLVSHNVSQRVIAPVVGVSKGTLHRALKDMKSEEGGQLPQSGAVDQSEGEMTEVASGPVGQKSFGLDGKVRNAPRSEEELTADWYWYSALIELDGLSKHKISEFTGVPYPTVVRTLNFSIPDDEDQIVLFCELWTERKKGRGWGEIAFDAGLKLRAVEWIVSEQNRPLLRDIIDSGSFVEWAHERTPLRLVTGLEVNQTDLQEMLHISQARVSQEFAKWKNDWEMNEERLELKADMEYTLPETGAFSSDAQDAMGLDLKVRFERKERYSDETDSSPIGWVGRLESSMMEMDPTTPMASSLGVPVSKCERLWREADMGAVNKLCTFSRTALDIDERPVLLEQLERYQQMLERIVPLLRRTVEEDRIEAGDDDGRGAWA